MGDERTASFEAKMKTKMCRFMLPIQSLCQGIEEKLALEAFRKAVIDRAATDNNDALVKEWLWKSIVDVRAGRRFLLRGICECSMRIASNATFRHC